ncbi:hypothetical protein HOLleu_13875 [Holothuria leucospilota]|uniref:Uncharacterized protein n=1 Tax=Holothuria leucospilota TaxID=206669 RepID=A0A9Q1C7U3_HOLLE|nr:hypothetical protein HOLleu_13875 [Holothuria leucospilota]
MKIDNALIQSLFYSIRPLVEQTNESGLIYEYLSYISHIYIYIVTRRPVRNTGLNPSTSEWKVPETSNFNAAFLELSRSENCLRYVPIIFNCVLEVSIKERSRNCWTLGTRSFR